MWARLAGSWRLDAGGGNPLPVLVGHLGSRVQLLTSRYYLQAWCRGQDSNLRSPLGRRFYRPLVLATHPPRPSSLEPEGGFEPTNLPITSRLRCHCATRAGSLPVAVRPL